MRFRVVAVFFCMPLLVLMCSIGLSVRAGDVLANAESESSPGASLSPRAKAHAILEKAVRDMGPVDAFDQIRSARLQGKSIETSGESQEVEILMVYPESEDGLWMHIQAKSEEEKLVERRLAGARSWAEGIGILPADLHRDAVRYASTKLITLLRYRHHPHAEVSLEGAELLEGEKIDLVRITLYGTECLLEIDRSGRVRAVRFRSSPIQEEVEGQVVRRAYGDHRRVGDWVLPFHQTVTVGGEPYNEWHLRTFEIDATYDPALFAELPD